MCKNIYCLLNILRNSASCACVGTHTHVRARAHTHTFILICTRKCIRTIPAHTHMFTNAPFAQRSVINLPNIHKHVFFLPKLETKFA